MDRYGRGRLMNDLELRHVVLVDDGSLDTVVEADCPLCGEHISYKFSAETREMYGNDYTLMATEAWENDECLLSH